MHRGIPLVFWSLSVLLGCSALALTFGSVNHREKVESLFWGRETILSLADELRQSSDDLTRFARSYAATSDPRYRDRFEAVLAIREGERARPAGYQYAFWDLEIIGELEDAGTVEAKSMQQRLLDQDLASDVLFLMNRSKKFSDELASIETEAFKSIENDQPLEALELLYGDSYNRSKADIMRPIRTLQETVDRQTSEQLNVAIARQRALETKTIATLLGSLIFGALAGLWRRRQTEA